MKRSSLSYICHHICCQSSFLALSPHSGILCPHIYQFNYGNVPELVYFQFGFYQIFFSQEMWMQQNKRSIVLIDHGSCTIFNMKSMLNLSHTPLRHVFDRTDFWSSSTIICIVNILLFLILGSGKSSLRRGIVLRPLFNLLIAHSDTKSRWQLENSQRWDLYKQKQWKQCMICLGQAALWT